ncbi:MAG: hypothetical protein P8J20_12330 [Novosphingobium sp.]|nr:hypothetical protein [Novosphingobium sp.]
MAKSPKAKTGGAKLNRTETVTVRLDPKLNYLCELASRAQRRTKSSFIEWAVADALKRVELPEVCEYDAENDNLRAPTISEKSADLWHVDEPDRLVALAINAPALLTHGEQIIWKLIQENGHFWKGKFNSFGEWAWEPRAQGIVRDRLREHWETLKSVASEEMPISSLPSWRKTNPTDDLDDDIPF